MIWLLTFIVSAAFFPKGFAADEEVVVSLSNCVNGCITMPLMIGFNDDCNESCQSDVMQGANVGTANIENYAGLHFINEISDDALMSLQTNGNIKFIECDQCIVTSKDDPVCGSNNVTYGNIHEFECGLKCRGSDSSLSVAYTGKCGTQSISSENEEEVAQFCTYSKPTSNSCAFKGTCQFNPRSCLDETDRSEIVFDTCECRDGVFNCEDVELVCDDVEPSCPQEMPIPNSACNIEDLQCSYRPFGCPEREEKDEEPYGIWLEECFCEGGSWLCVANDMWCQRNENDDDSFGSAVDNNDDEICGSPTDNCMNEQNHQECINLKEAGCSNIGHYEYCPTEFFCDDQSLVMDDDKQPSVFDDDDDEQPLVFDDDENVGGEEPPGPPPLVGGNGTSSENNDDVCGSPTDNCMNEQNHQECINLKEEGCASIMILESCPAQFLCEDQSSANDDDLNNNECLSPTDDCMNEQNYQECLTLKQAGCTSILVSASCPVQFRCEEQPLVTDDDDELGGGGSGGEEPPPQEDIPLGNCDDDCMTMPLILTFADDCDTTCATEAMILAEIGESSYHHLAAQNIILLQEVTDDQLAALRKDSYSIRSIECDQCSVGIEDTEVCGSNDVTYKNKDELNCGLKCRGADPSVKVAYHGTCQDGAEIVPLTNCADDCMAMPLMIGFKESCDSACVVITMVDADIGFEKYDHLHNTNTVLLKEASDEGLAALQRSGEYIDYIECNSCVSASEVSQVCGTNGVTYKNEDELSCGLKCNGANETVTIASQGICSQGGGEMADDDLITLSCDEGCTRMPLLIVFKDEACGAGDCALETMKRANIPESNFDYLRTLNIIVLNSVTDDQLLVLRGEKNHISFIECDACVDVLVDSPVCSSNGITFRNVEELACENKCREITEEIYISSRGPCDENATTLPPAEEGEGGLVLCFSSLNQVQLSNGEAKQMNQLQLGDKVLTQSGQYETIYSWGHYNSEKDAQFVQLLPSRVELSSNHLIFLESNLSPVPAGTVKAGDVLQSGETVTSVRYVTRRGVYAPFTKSGTIVVNDQVASTYVSLQEKSSVLLLGSWSTGITYQWLAHAFEVPHYLWCSLTCAKESYSDDGISTWVAMPLNFFTWSLQLPATLQVIIFLPILILFGILALVEIAMDNNLITAGFLATALLVRSKKYTKRIL